MPKETKKQNENIQYIEIEESMKRSYLDYAMSVIVGRALPDVRDGLKPVHRRILHAMNERAWRSDRPYVKSAKIVGEVIGNYHPHGDAAVYDTLVRMTQDFSMRKPLIDGQGNFGSIDGDPPAAYRYTEARLSPIAQELLKDIDKETVDFVSNFDETRKEPVVLPAAFPNLLVNGSSGIAVGMATNIPPHNLGEVIDAVIHLIDNPDVKIKQLLKFIKGPDFPTGGIIVSSDSLLKAYEKGKDSVTVRAKVSIEEKKNKENIIVTEIPYQVNKSALISRIADLVNKKVIEGISDLRDESDREGLRIVIGCKKGVSSNVILNLLYKHTQLQISYGINLLALVNNKPTLLNLKDLLLHYIEHRKEIIIRRTKYELRKAEERAHILEGLKIALENIDEVISIIKSSKTVEDAQKRLIKRFQFTEIQAKAILDMRLQKLTNLETKKIIDELKSLLKLIKELKLILKSEKKVFEIVKNELLQIKEKYNDERKTEITYDNINLDFKAEDLIDEEDMVVTITNDGFIRRLSTSTFKKQRRGGKGVIGISTKKEDYISHITIASTHDFLLLFSNKGKIFGLKVFEIPESTKNSRGKSLKGIINLASGEHITAICSVSDFEGNSLCMITKNGILKKTALKEFSNVKKGGIIAINLNKKDELVDVKVVKPADDLVMATSKGLLLRTNIGKMRSMGRNAAGIIGMRLTQDDYIIGMDIVDEGTDLLTVTSLGYGKKTKYSLFATKGRGGKGMTYIKLNNKNGRAIGIKSVRDNDEIILTTKKGMTIRLNSKDISYQGRTAGGVKLVELNEGDEVTNFAVVHSN